MKKTKIKRSSRRSESARIIWQFCRNKTAVIGLIVVVCEIVIAIFADKLIPYDYTKMDIANAFALPSSEHLFGCDDLGRDIFSRVLFGSRFSLVIGISSVAAGTLVGLIIGAVAGFWGGWVDNIIMRILDVIQSLPGMLLMIVVAAVLGTGITNTIIAMAISIIPGTVRILRGQMMKERDNEYVEAAIAINCRKSRIIFRHLVPNSMSPVIVSTTMNIAAVILGAAGLSFIGLGVQPPNPEWGAMLSAAREYMRRYPHLVIFPGLAIAITVLAFNLLGDGLRDALDPKLKN